MYCYVSNSTVSTVCNCPVHFNLTILLVSCIIKIRLPYFNLNALYCDVGNSTVSTVCNFVILSRK